MNRSPIDHIFTLQRTPFALAPVLHRFYERSEPKNRDVLLSYLVLPIILYPPMRAFLMKSNVKSSLRTMCMDQNRLVGLEARIEDLKSTSSAAMTILFAERAIEIDDSLTVRAIAEVRESNANREMLTAGIKLAAIFADLDVVSIYRNLGLRSL